MIPTPFPWQTTRPKDLLDRLIQVREMSSLAGKRGQTMCEHAWENEAFMMIDEIIAALDVREKDNEK